DAVGPPTRVIVEISPAAPVAAAADPNGRVIARVEADALDLGLPPSGGGLVEQIRAGDQPNTIAMVLAGTAGTARINSATADNITRITVDIPAAGAPAGDISAAPPAPPPPAAPPAEALPLTPRPAFRTVVLDPGHGGEDAGVRGTDGVEEKQLTLDIARRVRQRLE